jgi:hypothetical protein
MSRRRQLFLVSAVSNVLATPETSWTRRPAGSQVQGMHQLGDFLGSVTIHTRWHRVAEHPAKLRHQFRLGPDQVAFIADVPGPIVAEILFQ